MQTVAEPDGAVSAVPSPDPSADAAAQPPWTPAVLPGMREIGGPTGPEPTRYGDWEKNGRCIDF